MCAGYRIRKEEKYLFYKPEIWGEAFFETPTFVRNCVMHFSTVERSRFMDYKRKDIKNICAITLKTLGNTAEKIHYENNYKEASSLQWNKNWALKE